MVQLPTGLCLVGGDRTEWEGGEEYRHGGGRKGRGDGRKGRQLKRREIRKEEEREDVGRKGEADEKMAG